MKRLLPLALALCLLLSSCGSMLNRSYSAVSTHLSESISEDDPTVLKAESYQMLVNDLLYFISIGAANGTIRLYQYPGDVAEDLEQACSEVLNEDPLGSYAARDIKYSFSRIVSYYECQFELLYRRSQGEIASITTMTGSSAIRDAMEIALSNFDPQLVFRTSSYSAEPKDLAALLQEAYHNIPSHALGFPAVTTNIYPRTGESSQRIVELLFTWPDDPAVMSQRANEAASAVSALASQAMQSAFSQTDQALYLARGLQATAAYTPSGSSSIYAALINGGANSEGLATAYTLACQAAGIQCVTVLGTLNQRPHWWNIVTIDGQNRHIDLTASLDGVPFRLDSEFSPRYSWNQDLVPPCT